jgi:V-type H+-transporting ATPase subunit a
MGAFATYTGLIYNDIFSKSLHLFNSGWDLPVNGTIGTFNGHTYPFGLDPGWHGASNALIFTNSYKMKMSIVIGVIHVSTLIFAFMKLKLTLQKMTFALCLQVPNHIKFKNQSDIWTNFLPQMLFLQSIFGYLVVCILYKWSVDWSKSPISPPSLLNMLINMFLSPGTINPDEQLYVGQGTVQGTLLLIAALCVPWLLCAKPYLKWKEIKRIHEQGYLGLSSDHDVRRTSSDDTLEAEEEGDGRAIVEDMEEEHVSSFSLPGWVLLFQLNSTFQRNRTTLVR